MIRQIINKLIYKHIIHKRDYKPVYRVDILKYAKRHKKSYYGLCAAITDSCKVLIAFKISYLDIKKLFPLFGTNIRPFNGDFHSNREREYWWPAKEWHTGREAYLDWLIEQYKDDKTDLKTLKL